MIEKLFGLVSLSVLAFALLVWQKGITLALGITIGIVLGICIAWFLFNASGGDVING